MLLRVETLAIGDELLTGRIADTNSAFVGSQLFAKGLRLQHTQALADDPAAIEQRVRESAERADVVICFGGLGPTSDDRTAEVIARMLGTRLVNHAPSLQRLETYCLERNREVTAQLLKQVVCPESTTPLPNSVGMAPGFQCRFGQCDFFFLPGVPTEMKAMFLSCVLPAVIERAVASGAVSLLSHTWKCIGIPEAQLQRQMETVEACLPAGAFLGYRTKYPENYLTLYWKSNSGGGTGAFETTTEQIRSVVKPWCYTEEEKELETLVLDALRRTNLSLAFAESCTGGLCAQRMTRVPGSSDHFWGGVVVYQVLSKKTLLDIELADPLQAVSASCSKGLAEQMQRRSGCAVVAAITGYMGPSGGTPADPIGTSYACVLGPWGIRERRLFHPGIDREANQWGASSYVLDEVRRALTSGSGKP